MTYLELLSQKEWTRKCNEILQRDKFRCCDCGCLGFHNGGNFMILDNIEEVDKILSDYLFYNRPFSEFYRSLLQQGTSRLLPEYIEIKCEEELEFESFVSARFLKPKHRDITDIDSFPIIFSKSKKPTKVIQRPYGWGITTRGNEDRVGEIFEFVFPEVSPGIIVCIEQYEYAHHITIQIENTLVALVFARSKNLFKGLNIHHKYYVYGLDPWEYKNEVLVSLCENCHQKRHQTPISVFDKGQICRYVTACSRCGGSGYLPQYHYYEHGVCFKCGGEGVVIDDYFE